MASAQSGRGIATACLTQIQACLARHSPPRLEGDRRAVVACLLRRRPARVAPNSTEAAASTSALDVFFILRSGLGRTGSGARWAGQVGFPGGHVEANESDHEAVSRECLEEVGLDLDRAGAYRFLGCVRERLVPRTHGSLVVACRVYEQVVDELEPLQLQAEEVAACGWAPLELLLEEDCATPLLWSAHHGPSGAAYDGFPSVGLPVEGLCLAEDVTEELAREGFVLWGLTLGIVNDFLLTTGLRSAPISLPSTRHAGHTAAAAAVRASGQPPSLSGAPLAQAHTAKL